MHADGELWRTAFGRVLGTALVASVLEFALAFVPPNLLKKISPPIVSGLAIVLPGIELIGAGIRCALFAVPTKRQAGREGWAGVRYCAHLDVHIAGRTAVHCADFVKSRSNCTAGGPRRKLRLVAELMRKAACAGPGAAATSAPKTSRACRVKS